MNYLKNNPNLYILCVIYDTYMTLYRTTKIPEFYFNQIEDYLKNSSEFISVSEFIREAIKEKFKIINNPKDFLLTKDIVFNEEVIQNIHSQLTVNEKDMLKNISLRSIIEKSLDLNFLKFLSKFLHNFARIHPFKDGNKRTSWLTIDVFLRINNKKLILKAKKDKETKNEIFIWQNSTNQKTIKEIIEFLTKHIVNYNNNSSDVKIEIKKSIKENKLLLEKLSL